VDLVRLNSDFRSMRISAKKQRYKDEKIEKFGRLISPVQVAFASTRLCVEVGLIQAKFATVQTAVLC
jgi:hypothetical protein